ncbi:MAG: hypothetical protein ABW213_00440 [Tardiphaga sp.]
MKFLSAIALLALLTGPAAAQMMNLMPEVKTKTPEEKEQDAITDKAYRESLRKIPDNKAASDPWGSVRSETPKAATAKPRTKTGSAAN